MNEETIALILRASKPASRRLRDGWIHAVVSFAREFQAANRTFDALAFLTLADLSLDDERRWREKYECSNDPSAVA